VIGDHLPALQIVVPLLSAPICLLVRRGDVAWAVATAVGLVSFAITAALLAAVLDGGPISYALGGWAPPFGIEYRVDVVNAFVLLIVSAINVLVLAYARTSVAAEVEAERLYLFYAVYQLNLTGLLGIAITGDAFNVFVFLEISSLSSYVLISLGKDRRALMAAFRYLILGTIGATFFVIGVGLLYAMTGTLNMADLAARLPAVGGTRTVLVGFAFIAIGMGLKAAIFPLHQWLPNAYCYAPSAVTTFLAATATKVSIYVLLRFAFTVFGSETVIGFAPTEAAVLVVAVLGMLSASTVALFEADAKRLLAYSSVAQIGYMVLGIGLATVAGLTATLVHMFNHALIKGALFMALGAVFLRIGSVRVDDLAGLGKEMPWTMAAFVGGGLSLIGVPLTTGFISKWVLVEAVLSNGQWYLAAAILFASLLAIGYVWRVVEAAYFQPRPQGAPAIAEAPFSMLLPTWLLVAANIYFGIDSSLTLGVARRAAETLIGVGP
jgi:multicomponent Na+:H+ antiporter subunit D